MDIDMKVMAEKLRENNAYKIYYHVNPDGDAVMSAYALAVALQSIGISCEPLCSDSIQVPEDYKDEIDALSYNPLTEEPSEYAVIAVDSSSNKRIGKKPDEKIDYCIDHHDNDMNARYKWVEPRSSSCVELIYKLILEMGIEVDSKMADLLYIGLITDTLCFRSYSTNKESLRAAASLAEKGADIVRISRQYALEKTKEKLAVERIMINSFHYTSNDRVLGCMITQADMKEIGVDASGMQGINIIVDQIRGLDIGIIVREIAPERCRVSIRTYTGINAIDICKHFGGGGHEDRAGFEKSGGPEDVLTEVEQYVQNYL